MNKKMWSNVLLTVIFLLAALTSVYFAYADDISWHYDDTTKTLYITGSGNMDSYAAGQVPWNIHMSQLENVVVEDGVTGIGKNAFAGANSLCNVSLADSVTSIGEYAFASCPALLSLSLDSNIISFENNDISFAYNGLQPKEEFVITTVPGSYALSYAVKNNISYVCEDIRTGSIHISLQKGMMAYLPYTAKYSGQYRCYSVSKHDTMGYLYGANMNQITYNDDHSVQFDNEMGSTDFGLTFSLTKGEHYYLGVKIFNPSLKAQFDVYFEPVEYTISGTLFAMASPDGTASAIPLANAQMDGVALSNGTFTKTISGLSETVTFTCDGVSLEHTFSVDDGDEIVLTMMMCDVNEDGIVNAKDYALMLQSNSPYLSLFESFLNYNY